MNGLKETFGNKLRALRKEHDLSQNELGKAAGTTGVTISAIEMGKQATNLDILEAVSHQLDIAPSDLIEEGPLAPPGARKLRRQIINLLNQMDEKGLRLALNAISITKSATSPKPASKVPSKKDESAL